MRKGLDPEARLAKEFGNRLLVALRDDFEPAFRARLAEIGGER